MTNDLSAHVLVSTTWVSEHVDDPDLRIVECDEDALYYEGGHISGAVKLDWYADLNDPYVRDFISAQEFAQLMQRLGISPTTTIVLYGDTYNWWACYAYWIFALFGHASLKIMDGGRARWSEEGRPLTRKKPVPDPTSYQLPNDSAPVRIYREDVLAHIGHPAPRGQLLLPPDRCLIDVRSAKEYRGEQLYTLEYTQNHTIRSGHIPGAINIPAILAVDTDTSRLKSRDELRQLYESHGVLPDQQIIVYCHTGERAALTWFVLHELLGYRMVGIYDGSWSEWGNSVGLPIANPSLDRAKSKRSTH